MMLCLRGLSQSDLEALPATRRLAILARLEASVKEGKIVVAAASLQAPSSAQHATLARFVAKPTTARGWPL